MTKTVKDAILDEIRGMREDLAAWRTDLLGLRHTTAVTSNDDDDLYLSAYRKPKPSVQVAELESLLRSCREAMRVASAPRLVTTRTDWSQMIDAIDRVLAKPSSANPETFDGDTE